MSRIGWINLRERQGKDKEKGRGQKDSVISKTGKGIDDESALRLLMA